MCVFRRNPEERWHIQEVMECSMFKTGDELIEQLQVPLFFLMPSLAVSSQHMPFFVLWVITTSSSSCLQWQSHPSTSYFRCFGQPYLHVQHDVSIDQALSLQYMQHRKCTQMQNLHSATPHRRKKKIAEFSS